MNWPTLLEQTTTKLTLASIFVDWHRLGEVVVPQNRFCCQCCFDLVETLCVFRLPALGCVFLEQCMERCRSLRLVRYILRLVFDHIQLSLKCELVFWCGHVSNCSDLGLVWCQSLWSDDVAHVQHFGHSELCLGPVVGELSA